MTHIIEPIINWNDKHNLKTKIDIIPRGKHVYKKGEYYYFGNNGSFSLLYKLKDIKTIRFKELVFNLRCLGNGDKAESIIEQLKERYENKSIDLENQEFDFCLFILCL